MYTKSETLNNNTSKPSENSSVTPKRNLHDDKYMENESLRSEKYGCPSRRKQLQSLAVAVDLILRHATITGVRGNELTL
eukprot:758444-Hanusia_phi.AAC.2